MAELGKFTIEHLPKATDYKAGGTIKYTNAEGKSKIVLKLNSKCEKTYEGKGFTFNFLEKLVLNKRLADLKELIKQAQ